MRILLVSQYFWPENFRINDIALGLKEQGHEVIVFTGKPNYPSGRFFKGYSFFNRSKETWNGITIYRAPLVPRGNGGGLRLAINYFSFLLAGSLRALFLSIKPDKILVYQLSPITMALPAIVFKKKTGAKLFLYIQDLWPQSIVAASGIRNRYIIKLLEWLTGWIYRQTDTLIIQSKAFRSYLTERRVADQKIVYLPNSTDPFYKEVPPDPAYKKYFPGRMNIVFAGNIGEAQSFNTLLDAAAIVKKTDPGICWVIIGEGRRRTELEQRVLATGMEKEFTFTGSFEPQLMPQFFAHADALVISLKKDFIFSLTIPNKLQSYMACGRPVIGSLDGEGRKIIDEAGCGLTSAAEDAETLAANIIAFSRMELAQREELGQRAYTYFKKEFDRDTVMKKLADILTA